MPTHHAMGLRAKLSESNDDGLNGVTDAGRCVQFSQNHHRAFVIAMPHAF